MLLKKFQVGEKSTFYKNGPSPACFSFIFGLFQTHIDTILQQINVKNVHSVYGAGIQTHDLWNVSLLTLPLDQGSSHLGLFVHFCSFSNKLTEL